MYRETKRKLKCTNDFDSPRGQNLLLLSIHRNAFVPNEFMYGGGVVRAIGKRKRERERRVEEERGRERRAGKEGIIRRNRKEERTSKKQQVQKKKVQVISLWVTCAQSELGCVLVTALYKDKYLSTYLRFLLRYRGKYVFANSHLRIVSLWGNIGMSMSIPRRQPS